MVDHSSDIPVRHSLTRPRKRRLAQLQHLKLASKVLEARVDRDSGRFEIFIKGVSLNDPRLNSLKSYGSRHTRRRQFGRGAVVQVEGTVPVSGEPVRTSGILASELETRLGKSGETIEYVTQQLKRGLE